MEIITGRLTADAEVKAAEFDKLFKGVLETYKNTSSHIHLSDQHLFATRGLRPDKYEPMRIAVGPGTDLFPKELKLNISSTMNEVSHLVLILLTQWKHERTPVSGLKNGVRL